MTTTPAPATPPATATAGATAGATATATADQLLLPVPDEDGAPFWEYAAQGELRVQACTACGGSASRPDPAARTASRSTPSGCR